MHIINFLNGFNFILISISDWLIDWLIEWSGYSTIVSSLNDELLAELQKKAITFLFTINNTFFETTKSSSFWFLSFVLQSKFGLFICIQLTLKRLNRSGPCFFVAPHMVPEKVVERENFEKCRYLRFLTEEWRHEN